LQWHFVHQLTATRSSIRELAFPSLQSTLLSCPFSKYSCVSALSSRSSCSLILRAGVLDPRYKNSPQRFHPSRQAGESGRLATATRNYHFCQRREVSNDFFLMMALDGLDAKCAT
jgi:hypothetical protein